MYTHDSAPVAGVFGTKDCTLYDIKIADYGLSKYNEEDKAPRFLRVSLHEVNSKTLKRKTWIQAWGSLHRTHFERIKQ